MSKTLSIATIIAVLCLLIGAASYVTSEPPLHCHSHGGALHCHKAGS